MTTLLIESVVEMSHDKEAVVYTPSKTFFWGYNFTWFYFHKEKVNNTLKKSDNFFVSFEVLPSLRLSFVQTNEKYKERLKSKR